MHKIACKYTYSMRMRSVRTIISGYMWVLLQFVTSGVVIWLSRVMLSLLLFICPLAIALSNDPCRRNESTEIHIIGFFPCTDPNDTRGIPVDNCDGIERIPIIKLALEEINERCDLLPGYRLVMNYANSAVSS